VFLGVTSPTYQRAFWGKGRGQIFNGGAELFRSKGKGMVYGWDNGKKWKKKQGALVGWVCMSCTGSHNNCGVVAFNHNAVI